MSATSPTSLHLPQIGTDAQPSDARRRLAAVAPIWVPAPRFPFITLISMILLGGVVGLLMFNTSMQQSSFAASKLTTQAQTLAQREQTLQMELQDLRDPQGVAERARALGMVPVTSPGFLRLSDGRFLGHPQAASTGSALDINEPGFRPPAAAYSRPPAAADAANQAATSHTRTTRGEASNADTAKHSPDRRKNRGTH